MGDILTQQLHGTTGHVLQTGNAEDQLTLAVAVDTGDADDLTGANLEGNVVDSILLADFGNHGQILYIQNHIRGLGRSLLDGKFHIAANHHPGQVILGATSNIHGADVLALAQNRAAVGNGHDLVELVGNEEAGLAFCRQILHDLQQLLNFLRSQHSGGVVKIQDLIVAIQHLQNFGALLHANGNILDNRIGVDSETILLRQCHDLGLGLVTLQDAVLGILHAQNDVIQNRETFHQFEVLMHHADTQGIGIIGVVNLNNFTVLLNHALFRLVQAEQNAHQGRLAGAVFAQQCMDFAALQLQRNIIICNDAGELLGNVHHLDCIRYVIQSNYLLLFVTTFPLYMKYRRNSNRIDLDL